MPDDVINNLYTAVDNFIFDLRNGNKIDEEKYHALCNALISCDSKWKDLESIPKKAAALLVDLPTSIETCSMWYEDSELSRVREIYLEIHDYVLQIVLPKDQRRSPKVIPVTP